MAIDVKKIDDRWGKQLVLLTIGKRVSSFESFRHNGIWSSNERKINPENTT